jgi:hypothetical protein
MKKFLTTFAGLAAAFAGTNATAKIPEAPLGAPQTSQDNRLQVDASSGQVLVTNANGDELEFVLKKSEQTGMLMAWHRSHSSHNSGR